MAAMKAIRLGCIWAAVISAALFIGEFQALSGFPNWQVSANGPTTTQGDRSDDFDFLI
jgi:predicted solute-binding protein